MSDNLFSRFLQALGAPSGQPGYYYRDIALGIVFVPCTLIATVLGAESQFDVAFAICTALAVISLLLAKTKRMLVVGAVGLASFRFGFAFLMTQRVLALGLAVLCAVIVWMLLVTAPGDPQ